MKKPQNLSALGEFGFISRIAVSTKTGTGVVTGIGDDCAVTTVTPGMQLLTSTDMLLEDVHFRRAWHDPYRLGRKSLAVNISDIAAMGGIPRWATLSLAIPADLPLDFLDEFTRGFLAMATEQGVTLIGGDTCSAKGGLAISVTILGEQTPDRIVRRSGAQEGDDIWATGTLGDAAMGLRMVEGRLFIPHPPPSLPLEGGGTEIDLRETNSREEVSTSPPFQGEGQGGDGVEKDFLLSRLLDPTPRVAAGIALAESGLVTAMIDISDGVLGDFGHIAELSGVGGEICVERLPVSDAFRSQISHMPEFPWSLPLSGGEDYELCFTAPAAHREKIEIVLKKCGIQGTPVGIVTRSKTVTAVHADGRPFTAQTSGFNHFS